MRPIYEKPGDWIYNELALRFIYDTIDFGDIENMEIALLICSDAVDCFTENIKEPLKAVLYLDKAIKIRKLPVIYKSLVYLFAEEYFLNFQKREVKKSDVQGIVNARKALSGRFEKALKEKISFVYEMENKKIGITPHISKSLKNELKGIKGIDWNN